MEAGHQEGRPSTQRVRSVFSLLGALGTWDRNVTLPGRAGFAPFQRWTKARNDFVVVT